jgi:hypothetical protein
MSSSSDVVTNNTILSDTYNEVLSPVITIKTPDSSRTIMTDDFSTPELGILKSTSMKISNGIQKTGQLTLTFRDPFGYYDSGAIYKGCRIQVKAKKKHQTKYINLFSGIIISDSIDESDRRRNIYTIVANSMRHILTHTAVSFERNIPFQNMKEDTLNLINEDPRFYIGNMIYDAFTNRNVLINDNGLTLQQRGNFTLKGIDRTIPLTIPSMNFVGYADGLFSQFQELGGLLFGVDEDNDVFARYPIYKSRGHVIKLHYNDFATDNPNTIMISNEHVTRSTSIEPSNYAEIMIGKAFDSAVLVNNSNTNSFVSLYNKDVAQQVDLRTTKLTDLTFILSKSGAGTNSADPENTNLIGYVATDDNNRLGPDVVAEFNIPLRFIPSSASPVQRINLKFKGTGEVDVTKKYWIVLQTIGDSEDNTVFWWNDGGKAASLGQATYSAIRDLPFGRGGSRAFIPHGWRIIKDGPVLSHTFTTSSPVIHVSKALIGRLDYQDPAPVESIQSPSGIIDSKTMEQYLGLAGEYASRIVITYEFPSVSIPNTPVRVGDSLLYYDSRGNENQVNITDMEYNFTAGTGRPLGATHYSLAGMGYELSKETAVINELASQFYCTNH